MGYSTIRALDRQHTLDPSVTEQPCHSDVSCNNKIDKNKYLL